MMDRKTEMKFHALACCVGLATVMGTAYHYATQDVTANENTRNPFLFDDPTILMLLSAGAGLLFLAGACAWHLKSKEEKESQNNNNANSQPNDKYAGGMFLAGAGKAIALVAICTVASLALIVGFGGPISARPEYEAPSGDLNKTLFGFMYGGLALLSLISCAPEIKKVMATTPR